MTSIAAQLTDFALSADPLPEAQRDVLHLSLLDWIACGRAGATEPVAQICRAMVAVEDGVAQAQMFGGGAAPARAAALVNGAASHALDYDDTHFAHIGHPSVAVLPAVFAVAERAGASGPALQEAALIGLEASVRVGVWLGRGHYQLGFHQTATAGAFGATLGCARLMGLTDAQTMTALGLTATRAAGLKAQFGTMGKPYNAGLAAQTGVEAATLAALGLTSNPGALEAFADTHHGAQAALPDGWLFDKVSHKFHACCHGLHATLEALATLHPYEDVEKIEIVTHPRWMSVCNQPAPETGLGAKFSYTTVAAMAVLGHDTANPDSYSDAMAQSAEVDTLRKSVGVTADDTLTETAAQVTVTDANGARLARHDLMDVMPIENRRARIRAKAASLLGASDADAIWAAIEGCADAGALLRAGRSG